MQPISTLSGGEQAKVKLCKLILKPCNLLILDEPVSGIDKNGIKDFYKSVNKLKTQYALLSFFK